MNVFRLLMVIGIAGGAAAYWKHHEMHHAAPGTRASSPGPFVALPPVQGQDASTVYVVAAENCPGEDAQRADRLAEDLSRRGIAVQRTHSARFAFTSQPDGETVARMNAIMQGPLPVVFVHGRAKGNPSLDEVAAEAGRPQGSP